jgi:toxin FitB
MSGRKVLLDTNVLIYASKGQINLDLLLSDYDAFFVSIISYMEVYGFKFQNESEKFLIDSLFTYLEIIPITYQTAANVITYRQMGSRKIKLPDAIILANANEKEAHLLSADWDDFVGFDDRVTIKSLQTY